MSFSCFPACFPIAANARTIVLVADKSVSYDAGNQTRQKFDVAFNKIRPMKVEGWASLISGPMDFGEVVVHLADEIYHINQATAVDSNEDIVVVKGIPECTKLAYQSCRRVEVVDHVLKPRLLSQEWYEKKSMKASPRRTTITFSA
jgi:hypothetical protein